MLGIFAVGPLLGYSIMLYDHKLCKLYRLLVEWLISA